MSFAQNIPLIDVDHIKAHLYANFLVQKNNTDKKIPKLPAIGLIVSGGHSSLYYIKNFKTFQLLGQTRDDAAGDLAAWNAHTGAFGTLVENSEPDDAVLYGVIDKIMSLFE